MSFFRRLFHKSDPPEDSTESPIAPAGTANGGADVDAPETARATPAGDLSRQTAPLQERALPDSEDQWAGRVEGAEPERTQERAEAGAAAPAEVRDDDQDDTWWQEPETPAAVPHAAVDTTLPPAVPAPTEQDVDLMGRAADVTIALDAAVLEDMPLAGDEDQPPDHELWSIDPAQRDSEGAEDATEEEGTRPLTAADVPALAALRSRRALAAAALRDIGRVRSVNQDSIFALLTSVPRESTDVSIGLFIVADGMGGHHGGEVASRMAIGTVAHYILAELIAPALTDGVTEALQPLIIAAVQEANRAIWEHAQSVGSDMGTTCTVALLLGRALYVGHVGDSRAYLATPTGMRLITNDHSTVGRLIQLGQLDSSEAREHPLRSQLYRTIGQHPDVLVDFTYQPLGDATHLLLCSDGLWGMLDEEVLYDVLEHTVWPQDACHELIARANLAGGDDNISAVVVTLPGQ